MSIFLKFEIKLFCQFLRFFNIFQDFKDLFSLVKMSDGRVPTSCIFWQNKSFTSNVFYWEVKWWRFPMLHFLLSTFFIRYFNWPAFIFWYSNVHGTKMTSNCSFFAAYSIAGYFQPFVRNLNHSLSSNSRLLRQ